MPVKGVHRYELECREAINESINGRWVTLEELELEQAGDRQVITPDVPVGQHVLYRFFAVDGALLYIGVSGNLPLRLRAHRHKQPWWHEVARCEVECFDDAGWDLIYAERDAICMESPRYNRMRYRVVNKGHPKRAGRDRDEGRLAS